MTKNPFVNAGAAWGYITLIAMMMTYGSQYAKPEDSVFAPIAFLSLFTFSAAMMGYVFLYQPFVLYFEGRKRSAVNLFLQTLGFFGVITMVMLGLAFSGILN